MMHRINIDESRANQRLAQQSKELGDITAILALQTSEDSASMITIAAVTMFFLPATFISVRSQTPFR
jgi:Mg2+ and Co2+ transporter CorA